MARTVAEDVLSKDPEFKLEENKAMAKFDALYRKTAKWDIEASLKKFSLGYSLNYFSVYEKVDAFFPVFIPSVKTFFERAGRGNLIQNIRFSYQMTQQSRLAILINNFTNEEYATRPGKMDPMRSFNVQLRIMF